MSRSAARLLVLLALVTAACGSTAQTVPDTALPDTSGGLGTNGPGGARDTDSSGLPATIDSSATDLPADADAPAASGSGAAPSARAGRATSPVIVPGTTATKIRVGIVAAENPNSGNAAFGAAGLEVHNIDDTYQAVIDDLNARGGIGGRKLELVVHRFGSEVTRDQLESQACETFTRDRRVFASLAYMGDNFNACMEKGGVPMVGSAQTTGYGKVEYARFPHLVDAGSFDLDDQEEIVVDGLRAQGWLSGWNPVAGAAEPGRKPSVGVLSIDLPATVRAVKNHTLPMLRAAGITRVDAIFVRPNLNDGQADVQAAVQKWKANGVDHVIFLDNSGGIVAVVFAINANSQAYFPRLGCDTGSCNQIVAEQMPPSTLRGAVLVGWSPLNDVPPTHDHVTDGRRRCEALMRSKGMAPYSRNDLNVMINVCDSVWFFEAAARSAGPLTADSLIRGAFAAGARYRSAGTFAVRITSTKRAGADAYRYATWDPTCDNGRSAGCFIYSGPIRRLRIST